MLYLILLNTANVLYVFCYGVRDVLWLRILAVAAMILLMPYYYASQAEPMFDCMIWQIVFIAINVYWIFVIVRERRPPVMTQAEQDLYNNIFKGCCSPKDMLRLIAQAQWKEAEFGQCLVKRKTHLDQLLLIHSGSVSVQVRGKELTKLDPGNLIGEMSFLTKNLTNADVLATGPVRYLSWQRDILEKMFESKVELKSAINEIIGRDLVQKLKTRNAADDLDATLI